MSKLPSSNPAQSASENRYGIVRFATQTEASAGTANDLVVSPARLDAAVDALIAPASTTVAGKIEIATNPEAVAKSESEKAIVPSNLAASGFLQYADVTITASQIKALATTPIALVAAPPAGSAHLFMGAMFKLNYGSEVFAESGDNLGIKYTNASGVQVSVTIETTGFIDQSFDTITNAIPVINTIVAATGAEAQALVLDNLNANITGNASDDSTVTVRTYYVTQAL